MKIIKVNYGPDIYCLNCGTDKELNHISYVQEDGITINDILCKDCCKQAKEKKEVLRKYFNELGR